MSVTNEELSHVTGGSAFALTWKVIAVVGGAILGAGALSGFTNPNKCKR